MYIIIECIKYPDKIKCYITCVIIIIINKQIIYKTHIYNMLMLIHELLTCPMRFPCDVICMSRNNELGLLEH